jgi:hypothetical protein
MRLSNSKKWLLVILPLMLLRCKRIEVALWRSPRLLHGEFAVFCLTVAVWKTLHISAHPSETKNDIPKGTDISKCIYAISIACSDQTC